MLIEVQGSQKKIRLRLRNTEMLGIISMRHLRCAEHALILPAAAQILPHLVHDTPLTKLAPTLIDHEESKLFNRQ